MIPSLEEFLEMLWKSLKNFVKEVDEFIEYEKEKMEDLF